MKIFIPAVSSSVEQTAAKELSTYLQKAYGEEFSILPECGCEPGIYVGYTEFAVSRNIYANGGINELNGAEAWLIRAVDNSLIITGGKNNMDRGIIYAAEHYLEDVVGVRFWNAMEEYVPSLSNFSIDPSLNLSGEPVMVMRHPSAGSFVGNDPIHSVRMRANYLHGIKKEWGGYVSFSRTGHCHTLDRYLPREGLFEQHPDWFAWDDSMQKRLSYGRYCLTNPELQQAFEDAFLKEIADTYAECDAKGESYPHHFHISLDDTSYPCHCPTCEKQRKEYGETGIFLRFVNRMARAAKKIYPNIIIEILAYQNYIAPPTDGVLPEGNIAVRFAPIDSDVMHSLNHPNNAKWLKILKDWVALCKNNGSALYIWDYNTTYNGVPTPNINHTIENYRLYAELGIQGMYSENEFPMLMDFWCLKQWLLFHLIEDPSADAHAIIADFMQKYYGPAAPFIQQWLEISEEESMASNLYAICVQDYVKFDHLSYNAYLEGNRLFDLAEESVRGNDQLTLRVRQARASLDMSICTHYDTLHYLAKRRGLPAFPIRRELCGLRYTLTVEQTKQQFAAHADKGEVPFWESTLVMDQWQRPYVDAPLPPQFEGKDVLQVSVSDYACLGGNTIAMDYVADDDSLSGYAIRLNVLEAPQYVRDLAIIPSRDNPRNSYSVALMQQNNKAYKDLRMEDLKLDEYALYHAADIDDLRSSKLSVLRICSDMIRLAISNLDDIFPGKKLSVWIRAKFSGEFYGGDPATHCAACFDRIYIMPKE